MKEEAWTDFETSTPILDNKPTDTRSNATGHNKQSRLSDVYAVRFTIRSWHPFPDHQNRGDNTLYQIKVVADLTAIPKDADFDRLFEAFKHRCDLLVPQAAKVAAAGGNVRYRLVCDVHGTVDDALQLDKDNWLPHVTWWLQAQHNAHRDFSNFAETRRYERTGMLEMQVVMVPQGCTEIGRCNVTTLSGECVVQ